MKYLWLLVPPMSIFIGCSIGQIFFHFADKYVKDWHRLPWWYFTSWMILGMCVIAPIILGGVMFGIAGIAVNIFGLKP